MTADFKYRAFISYSHRDKKWADWLHRALETYRVPKALVGKVGRDGPIPAKIFPVYRDRAETPAVADLQAYVQAALEQSAYLIVICSPNSRRSRWVDQEILRFKRLGREARIFALIAEGEPNDSDLTGEASALECFPNALRYRLASDGELSADRIEPAAADARVVGDGKENAKLKIIAGLLGADLDDLKQRDLENSRRRVRLYGAIASGMAILAVVAAVAGVLAYIYALRSQEATRVAKIQATTAERTTDFLVSLFSVADPESNGGDKVTARQMLDRGIVEVNSKLGTEDTVRGYLLRAMGQAYGGLGFYSKATGVLQAAANAARKSGNAEDILKTNLALAANLYANSDYDASRKLYQSSLHDAQTLYGESHPTIAEALTGLGDSEAALGDNDAADGHLSKALAMDIALHGEQSAQTAATLNSLGMLRFQQNRLADAEPVFKRALDIRRSLFGPRNSDVAATLINLGAVQYQRGDYQDAEATYEQALPIYRAVYGNEHPQVAVLLNNIGRSQLMGNRLAEAQTTLDQALAIDRRFLPKDDDQLVPPLNSLGMIALARGDANGAQPLLEEALRIGTLKNSPILDQILGNCSAMYAQLSRPDDARTALARARSLQSKQYGESLTGVDSWRAAVLDLIEASNALAAKDDHAALILLDKATPVLRARFGPDGFYTHQAVALTSLAQRNGAYGRRKI